MSTYEEKLRAVERAKNELAEKKRVRSEKEFTDTVGDILIENPGFTCVALDTDVDLPGFVVVKPPKSSAGERLRQAMWRTDKDASAAKTRSLRALVLDCLVYPSEEIFATIVDRHEFVIEKVSKECQRMGEAEKEAAGKG